MAFYDHPKEGRVRIVQEIKESLLNDLKTGSSAHFLKIFGDEDTYIRKAGYESLAKIYSENDSLRSTIQELLLQLLHHREEKVRQTVINSAGEIAKKDFASAQVFFETGLFDQHHSVRNAVIGSIKKSGKVNPRPVLNWAAKYLHHPDKEIRREICHGIELRGRTHPEDILPMLKELEFDKTSRVRKTLVHVLGQIAYKKGCLEKVIAALNTWKNKELVSAAIDEIIDVHQRYSDFAAKTQAEAIAYIEKHIIKSPGGI